MKALVLVLLFVSLCAAQTSVWTTGDISMHGGIGIFSVNVSDGSTINLTVHCNYVDYPCLDGPPYDQYHKYYTFLNRAFNENRQTEYWQMVVTNKDVYQLVSAPTIKIGNNILYNLNMVGIANKY